MKEEKYIEGHAWNGTSQSERLLGALLPESVLVEERSVTDLLAFSREYADLLSFYDQRYRANSSWQPFFDKDISIFLAMVRTTDLKSIDREHLRLVFSIETSRNRKEQVQALRQIMTHILDIARTINNWFLQASTLNNHLLNDVVGFELEVETAIKQKLGRALNVLQRINSEGEMAFGYSLDLSFEGFHKIWGHLEVKESQPFFAIEESSAEKVLQATKRARLLFRTFYSVLVYLVQRSEHYLQLSLTEKQDHQPDMGLFITFLHLLQHAQGQLNQLTTRHLNYYFDQILQQKKREAIPDQVNLFFALGDHIPTQFLPKGTLLEAGLDETGEEILFETNHDIRLNNTEIGALKSIYISKNRLIGADSSYQLITNIYAAHQANSADGMGLEFVEGQQNWPTFGEEQFDKSPRDRTMVHAHVGFAISAPILHLEEGNREIELVFRFDKTSASTLNRLILDISRNGNITRDTAYFKVFRDSLDLQISAETGWLKIEEYSVVPPLDLADAELTIRFTIQQAQPSILGYDPEVHGTDFSETHPVIKVMLKKEDSDYAYSFLRDLVLDTVFIHVKVDKVRNLELYNHIGPLDETVPFLPFGPVPSIGSYLLIGKHELFKKSLTDLKFNIDWQGLPDNEGGWETYYQSYNQGIENDSFQVKMTALSENNFFPEDALDQPSFSLFDMNPTSNKLESKTTFQNINLTALNIRPDFSPEMDSAFNNFTRSGFFKFELVSPRMAFGSDLYPTIFANVALENSKPPIKRWFRTIEGDKLELPNTPISPTIKELSLSYSASTRINVLPVRGVESAGERPENIFHIHPFGMIQTFSSEATLDRALLPQFNEDAFLFIGLKKLKPPQRVSLLFEMKESVAGDTYHRRPEITWSYLANNEWEPLKEESVLIDRTDNFTASGIVMIDIPKDISTGNVLLDKDLYWLRVSVKGDIEILSHTVDLHTQAVTATRKLNRADQPKELAPNSIIGLKQTLPSIKAVRQPYASFGGKNPEATDEFYIRVSERLRHKNRVLQSWDYERIVLERFPDIAQVKCVPYQGNESFLAYGTVQIVVVPKLQEDHGYKEPKVTFHRLQEIKDFLESLASPFADIEVRNPVYEKLKISCGVIFQDGTNDGIFLERLNNDIREFVCPWMFKGNRELDLGGSLNKNSLLTFVEKRSYVKFVTRFSVVQVINDDGFYTLEDTARDMSHTPVVQGSRPWSVLVPLPNHPISFLDREAYQSPDPAGIDTMILGTDFIIKEEEAEDLEDLRAAKMIQKGKESRRKARTASGPKSFLKIKIKPKST